MAEIGGQVSTSHPQSCIVNRTPTLKSPTTATSNNCPSIPIRACHTIPCQFVGDQQTVGTQTQLPAVCLLDRTRHHSTACSPPRCHDAISRASATSPRLSRCHASTYLDTYVGHALSVTLLGIMGPSFLPAASLRFASQLAAPASSFAGARCGLRHDGANQSSLPCFACLPWLPWQSRLPWSPWCLLAGSPT